MIAALRRLGFFSSNGPLAKAGSGRTFAHSTERKPISSSNLEIARRIWNEGVDPSGTPVGTYLLHRNLQLPPEMAMRAVRFHPSCPRDERHPAMLIAMHEIETFRFTAIQRLFLDLSKPPGRQMKIDSRMLGPVGGAAMMLTSLFDTFPDGLSFCPRLYIAEGFETALALQNQGYEPVWALGSAGAIARFPVLPKIRELVICADNDIARRAGNKTLRPGIDAAYECFKRWAETPNHRPRIWVPDGPGSDLLDNLGGDPWRTD